MDTVRSTVLVPGMKVMLVLLITAIFHVTQASVDSPWISIRLSKTAIRGGENFTAVCTVASTSNNTAYRPPVNFPVELYRRDCQSKEILITTNDRLENPFARDFRYNVSFQVVKEKPYYLRLQLSINGIKLSETGYYECRARYAGSNTVSTFSTTAVTPVSSIEQVILQQEATNGTVTNLTNGQSLYVEKGSKHKFICLVLGANPEPRISVFIGGRTSLGGSFNHHGTHGGRVKCENGPNWEKMAVVPYNRTRTGTVIMDDSWDGQPLVCSATAKIEFFGDEPGKIETANVTLTFKKKPTNSGCSCALHLGIVALGPLLYYCLSRLSGPM